MEIRDKFNTKEIYEKIINSSYDEIDEDLIDIEERKEDEKNGIQKYPRPNLGIIKLKEDGIYMSNFTILMCKYSMGEPINEVRENYLKAIPYFVATWKKSSGYEQMVEMLSIGIMLNIKDEYFNTIIQCVKDNNPNDFLIDLLINYKNSSWGQQSEKFMWNKPYKLTQEIVELAKIDKEKTLRCLKKYLGQWYKSIEIKTHNKKHMHYGYWCWEAGALVKILGLNDSSLKDQPYYPYDMVHFKD